MDDSLRAVVIEGDYLLVETLVDVLRKLGCEVSESAASVQHALQLVDKSLCDFAVVDLDLKCRVSFPVLDHLQDRGIPFLLATGAFVEQIPLRHRSAICVPKPSDMWDIRRALDTLGSDCDSPLWAERFVAAKTLVPGLR